MDSYYHYTSVDAIVSIMKNRALWFTRSEFLNDPADCKLLTGILEKYLESQNVMEIAGPVLSKKPGADLKTLKKIYDKAPLIDYIKYLQKHINLYVLSLTKSKDQVSMWNNYGNGGMEIEVDMGALIHQIRERLLSPNQYVTYSSVNYISEEEDVEKINLTPCRDFPLDSQADDNIFGKHAIDPDIFFSSKYKTTKLKDFINNYIIEYFYSLYHLSKPHVHLISLHSSQTDIFKAVHKNTFQRNCQPDDQSDGQSDRSLEFKNDLTLYMLVLSALIKSKSYEYENEFRIVVFENALKPTCEVEYGVQNMFGQRYIRPYWDSSLKQTKPMDMSFIKKVILSPLTRNLPIDCDLYAEVVADFMNGILSDDAKRAKKIPHKIAVEWSKHKIRW